MREQRGIRFAMLCSWLGKLASVLSNLLIIPLLFRHVDKETLGVWYTLNGSNTVLALMGLGITPALTRQIAELSGRRQTEHAQADDETRLADLLVTGRNLLRILAVVNLFTAFAIGSFFVGQLHLTAISPRAIMLAWALMCLGFSLNTWWSYLDSYLAGMGHVGWDVLISGAMLCFSALGSATAVCLGGGLISLAAVPVVMGLINRVLLLNVIRWKLPELTLSTGRFNRLTARTLAQPAMTMWVGSLGTFLILRTDNYFIATLRGAREIPAYQAAYSLIFNVYQLAMSRVGSSCIFVSRVWQRDAPEPAYALTLAGARFAAVIMAGGCAFLLTTGRVLTDLWLGPGNFVGLPVMAIFCVMITLEAQHSSLFSSAWAAGESKYAGSLILAGLLNIVFTFLLIRPLGLVGVTLGTCLAQLLTNNWYLCWRSCHFLGLPFRRYAVAVWPVWLATFGGCAALQWLAVHWAPDAGYARRPLALVASMLVSVGPVACFLRGELVVPVRGILRRVGLQRPATIPTSDVPYRTNPVE